MRSFLLRRLAFAVINLALLSVVSFAIIQLPPGDFLTSYIASLGASGASVQQETIQALRVQYGLDQPVWVQYLRWVSNILRGNWGQSFFWNMPVKDLMAATMPSTIAISLVTLLFTYAVALPIGIYSATHQYSVGDYVFTVIGFFGLATPTFLLALVLMFLSVFYLGVSVGGLFSTQFIKASWSLARAWDLAKHLPIPVIVVGLAETAGLIRVLRATLLDELRKQYVITARAKGVSERVLLFRYPVRIALNPVVSSLGWVLPGIVSGATIAGIVLNLPTTGPLLFEALIGKDMYLAGSIVLVLSAMVIIGMFLSDLLLVALDPRIRLEGRR